MWFWSLLWLHPQNIDVLLQRINFIASFLYLLFNAFIFVQSIECISWLMEKWIKFVFIETKIASGHDSTGYHLFP
jgi:hypothetical protein